MNTEFEVKFCRVNHEDIRKHLEQLGAELVQPMRLMRRVTIDNDFMKKDKDAFVRIRDQGDKVTITYKQFDNLSIDGAKEIEIEVDDFENAVKIFTGAGLPFKSFQESKRESWEFNSCMIELDEWPWLDPYIEIEGPNSEEVKQTALKLGFQWDDAVFGDVMAAYRQQYPHLTEKDTVGNIPNVRFGDPLPDFFKN